MDERPAMPEERGRHEVAREHVNPASTVSGPVRLPSFRSHARTPQAMTTTPTMPSVTATSSWPGLNELHSAAAASAMPIATRASRKLRTLASQVRERFSREVHLADETPRPTGVESSAK